MESVSSSEKNKVVHYISSLNIGGTQVLIKSLMSNVKYKSHHQHFFVVEEDCGFFDKDIVELGGKILRVEKPSISLFRSSLDFCKILYKLKPEIVHSHVSTYSGIVMLLSYMFKVPKRIAHCHSFTTNRNKLYVTIMKTLISSFSTKLVSCSNEAGKSLFKKPFITIPNGIDVENFTRLGTNIKRDNKKNVIRIAHVGRFVKEKGHSFILEIIELLSKEYKVEASLFGTGYLMEEISEKAKKIDADISFKGDHPNPYESLLEEGRTVMVFPSIKEGFGIAIIEAQACGIRTVLSSSVPGTTHVVPELLTILPATCPAMWKKAIVDFSNSDEYINSDTISKRFFEKGLSLECTVENILRSLYK